MKEQQVSSRMVYSFFGAPGSGKGTLAQKLVTRKGYRMLSTGNLCRQHVAQGTAFGKMLNEYLKQGHLIPDALVTDMVIDWIEQQKGSVEPVILDGFPRTKGQAELFINFVQHAPELIFKVVVFAVPDEEIVRRLSQRVVCSNKNCQVPFADADKLTACTFCGSELIKRDDDREEVVRERLVQFPLYAHILLDYYRQVKQPVTELDITSLQQEAVYERFLGTVCMQ